MRIVSALTLAAVLTAPLSLTPASYAAPPTCGGLKATLVGNAKANTLLGTPKRDVIVAGAGDDTIRGRGGRDVICAGEGGDIVTGGEGNDRLYGESDGFSTDQYGRIVKTGDYLIGGQGNDILDLGYDPRPGTEGASGRADTVSYVRAPAAVVVDFRAAATVPITADGQDSVTGYAGGIRIQGSPWGDTIKGTNKADVIAARGGDDTIFGHGGDDVISADAADAPGNDRLYGMAGDDTLSGTLGVDLLTGGGGSDTLTSTSQNHQIFRGGGGRDTISFPLPVEPGFTAKGHGGQDRLRLLPNPNPSLLPKLRIDQMKSKTTIRGLAPYTLEGKINGFSEVTLPARATTTYRGTNKAEMVTAHPDHGVRMYGRGGSDVLIGSNERDRLDGGRGYDVVRAKGGNDKCKHAERRSSC